MNAAEIVPSPKRFCSRFGPPECYLKNIGVGAQPEEMSNHPLPHEPDEATGKNSRPDDAGGIPGRLRRCATASCLDFPNLRLGVFCRSERDIVHARYAPTPSRK